MRDNKHEQKKREKKRRRARAKSGLYTWTSFLYTAILILLVVFVVFNSTTYSTGELFRPSSADIGTDEDAVIGLELPSEVEAGTTSPLVSVRNNFDSTKDFTLTLTGATAANGDIVIDGINRGDSHTMTLAAAGEKVIDFDSFPPAWRDSPATFNVVVQGGGLTAETSRSVPLVKKSGGGGGIGAAEDLEFVVGSAYPDVNGQSTGARFQIENTGGETVTITDIEISVKGGPTKQLVDSGAGEGAGQREIFIDSASNSGVTEDAADGYLDIGSYPLGNPVTLTQEAAVAPGNTATVYLFEFRKNNGRGESIADRTLTVTLTASDGSTITYSTQF